MKSNNDESELVDEEKRAESLKGRLYQLIRLGISLRQDWFFHIVFGRAESAPFLLDLMNGVFRNADQPTLKSIIIKNPFTFGRYYDDKDVVVDVAAEDELGNQYDIEMQTWNQANFRERIVYYLEKIGAEQLKKGDSYSQLRKVVGIVFVDFPIWSEQYLKQIKNLTPDLVKKLKETQFETVKLMSVENGVVFSDCLSLYFIRIPETGESVSSSLRDPQLINWLKAFRFPASTSEEEILQMEKSSPKIKELINQMFEMLTTPDRRAYILSRQRAATDRITMLEEQATLKKEQATLKKEQATLKKEYAAVSEECSVVKKECAALTNKVETLEQERQKRNEEEIERQELFRKRLVKMATSQFDRPVAEVKKLLEGRNQEILDEAFDLLLSNVDYEEFVKFVSKAR